MNLEKFSSDAMNIVEESQSIAIKKCECRNIRFTST